jgi:predicted 3-demethylubiquinone-9 3-methyltransferase (glyoxalase superfamily)
MRICLWLDGTAEEAAAHYIDTFGGEIESTARYGAAAAEMSGQPEGAVMAVAFTAGDQQFLGLNGGPQFRFNESISLVHSCQDQAEIDRVWDALTSGGGEESQCGWCKDRWGLSWQITPRTLTDALAAGGDEAKRAFEAMMPMKKIDVATIEAARRG